MLEENKSNKAKVAVTSRTNASQRSRLCRVHIWHIVVQYIACNARVVRLQKTKYAKAVTTTMLVVETREQQQHCRSILLPTVKSLNLGKRLNEMAAVG